ncbi:hypothetical protein [Paenibacillus azoreducens]|uniref:Uncharacterized protein n=1 Tax=Paenibacillus azoreducens TaxID=116718 RepID=A0A919YHG0_9BACL|nr:hypothetical protein [Paenibacillus azoreducens]GIO48442.1 hypothetical protein J34TS1_32070 [Paenibacillus azoreducens]
MQIVKTIVSICVGLIAGYVIPFTLLLFGLSLVGDFRIGDPDGYLYLAVLVLSVAIFIFTIVRLKIYGYSFLALFIGFCVFLTLMYK